jgi:hypothetical protein
MELLFSIMENVSSELVRKNKNYVPCYTEDRILCETFGTLQYVAKVESVQKLIGTKDSQICITGQ